MARLVYSMLASVDGYVVDANGDFDWAAPTEEVHAFVNELERPIGTYLYGRRMYDVMKVWQDLPGTDDASPAMRDYAGIWRAADKVVYSTSMDSVTTPRTRLERDFDPAAVQGWVSGLEGAVSIGGPTLAAHALRSGIVDDLHVLSVPVVVGGGTSCWPAGARLDLDLVSERRFARGTVHTHYRVRR